MHAINGAAAEQRGPFIRLHALPDEEAWPIDRREAKPILIDAGYRPLRPAIIFTVDASVPEHDLRTGLQRRERRVVRCAGLDRRVVNETIGLEEGRLIAS